MPSLILLNIVAAVCLLLLGLRHLKSGMTKGFGGELRRILQAGTKNRMLALGSGVLVTLLVQSSTAAILIVGTFLGQGLIPLSSGIAMALGADLGTAMVAALLSLDLRWIMPFLITIGFILSIFQDKYRVYNAGRILSGLGLMLLSLTWIRETTAPLTVSEVLPVVLHPLANDHIFGILLTAILTWVMHSSLAMILLLVSFTSSGVISPDFALYLVLGANLGGAFPAIVATWKDDPQAARVALANGLIRFTGVAVAYSFVPLAVGYFAEHVDNPAAQPVLFHLLFNACLCVLALPLTRPVGILTEMIRPTVEVEDDDGRPKFLNQKDLDAPSVALGDAARETLRMAELLQDMLERCLPAFRSDNKSMVQAIRAEDHDIDRLYSAIKDYLAKLLSKNTLDSKQATRAVHILTFATNLEHAGDVIDKNLMPLAEKRMRKQQEFSAAGFEEISTYHKQVLNSVKQAQQVFMSGDEDLAAQMLQNKRGPLREAEERAMITHLKRLQEGVPESIATTSLHLDIIRDLRRINTYMCAVAYNVVRKEESTAVAEAKDKLV
jgi:phosphate:Na+ symporter